jgi:glutamate racemase
MEEKERQIAFLDSGVGGVTVFEKLKKLLPNENYIYFGDLKNFPYGEKTYDELLEFTTKNFNFFKELGVKAVVMACNTTSATVYEDLKTKYDFKIYPIIQSCAKIIAQLPIKKIGVFATEATIKNGAYTRELKKHNPDLEVFELACPPWVKIVEENSQNAPESVKAVKFYLEKMLKNNPDKIILGCTHYPYLLEVLEKFASRELFIDPSEYFAEFIKSDLNVSGLLNDSNNGSEKFFVSANPAKFKEAAALFYDLNNLPKLIN